LGPNYYIFREEGGTLAAIMPKPSGEWLSEDVSCLKAAGFGMIVSLLEAQEARELGLVEEGRACSAVGLEFLHFPIADRGIPESRLHFENLVSELFVKINSGISIAIHCRAGIGRSGMVAAALLINDGNTVDAAIEAVSASRNVTTPDTEEQVEFLQQQTRLSR